LRVAVGVVRAGEGRMKHAYLGNELLQLSSRSISPLTAPRVAVIEQPEGRDLSNQREYDCGTLLCPTADSGRERTDRLKNFCGSLTRWRRWTVSPLPARSLTRRSASSSPGLESSPSRRSHSCSGGGGPFRGGVPRWCRCRGLH
jgi:hypothetical protein